MGLFDGQPDYSAFGFTNPNILGLLAGLGQASAPSRLPVTFGQVMGNAAGGLLGGQEAGLKMQGEQQKLTQGNAALGQLLDQMKMAAKYYGVPAPSMSDLRSGKFEGLLGSGFPTPLAPPAPIQGFTQAQAPGGTASGWLPQIPSMAGTLGGEPPKLAGAGPIAARLAFMGYGPEDRAAVLGNAAWESSLRPDASGDGGASFGLWQWQKDRRTGLEQFAKDTNRVPTDPSVQVEYMDRELRQRAPEFFEAKTLPEKVKIFQDKFELPAKDTSEGRTRLAQNFLAQPSVTDAGPATASVPGMPTQPDPLALREALAAQQYMFGTKPTDSLNALISAGMMRQGSLEQQLLMNEALNKAGVKPFLGGERAGVPIRQFNAATGRYDIVGQNPNLGHGEIFTGNRIVNVPGAIPSAVERESAIDWAKVPPAMFQQGVQVHPGGGVTSVLGYPQAEGEVAGARAEAAGAFKPEITYDQYGNPLQTTAAAIGQRSRGAGPLAAPQSAPAPAPRTAGGLAVGGVLPGVATGPPTNLIQPPVSAAPPAASMMSITGQPQTSTVTQRPEAVPATFPIQTPDGIKDISRVNVDDIFPGGQGLPLRPPPPPGTSYGPPNAKLQEKDVDRVEGYSKEAAENQKIYQDLAHLRDVLDRGLTTGKLTPLWTDMGNIAHSIGADWAIPKGYDPTDAAVFSKASTDLVFAAVKKLAGQVRVAEIQGYQQANPNITIPIEANYNIINDVLAAGKWQDQRAKLGNQFIQKYPGIPLSAFEDRFNEIAPLSAVTDRYRDQMIQLGAKMPGQGEASKAPIPTLRSKTIGGTEYHFVDGQWRPVLK